MDRRRNEDQRSFASEEIDENCGDAMGTNGASRQPKDKDQKGGAMKTKGASRQTRIEKRREDNTKSMTSVPIRKEEGNKETEGM